MIELMGSTAEQREKEVETDFQALVSQLEAAELAPNQEEAIEYGIYMKINGRMDDGYSEEALA